MTAVIPGGVIKENPAAIPIMEVTAAMETDPWGRAIIKGKAMEDTKVVVTMFEAKLVWVKVQKTKKATNASAGIEAAIGTSRFPNQAVMPAASLVRQEPRARVAAHIMGLAHNTPLEVVSRKSIIGFPSTVAMDSRMHPTSGGMAVVQFLVVV